MISCLYFVQSNSEYHDLMSFLLAGRNISGIYYLVFRENLQSTDGRMFLTSKGYLMAVHFLSHVSDLQVKITKAGLDPSALVDLYEIKCEDDNPETKAITITKSAKCIIFEKELKRFLDNKNFKFSDKSVLTIPNPTK